MIKRLILKYYLKYKRQHNYNSKYIISNKKLIKKNKFRFNFPFIKEYVYDIYESNIKKIFLKKKSTKFVKIVLGLIQNSNFNQNNKNVFTRWLFEEIAALHLTKKYVNKDDLVIDSEGFIQRIFIYSYKKKRKQDIINKYLKFCPLPNKLFVTSSKRFKLKIYENTEFNMEIREQKLIYKLTLKIVKDLVYLKNVNIKNIKKYANLI